MKKILYTAVPLMLVLTGLLLLSGDGETVMTAPERPTVKRVRTAVVTRSDTGRQVSFSGVLRAADRASLSFTQHGRLIDRPVVIGDSVKKGQILARIDRQPYQNALEAARSNLAELTARQAQSYRDLKRVRALVAEKAATTEELEQTEAGVHALDAGIEAAQANLAESERRLRETSLIAPFDGTVTRVLLEPGEYAQGGVPVLALSGKDNLELEVAVPESVLSSLQLGSQATVQLPLMGGRQVHGSVSSVGRAGGGPGRLFPVIISLKADRLIPGQTAELQLAIADLNQLSVPIQSVFNPGGSRPMVYRVRGQVAHRIPVQVGRVIEERVTVTGALQAGDQVVTAGFFGLIDNETVEVIQ